MSFFILFSKAISAENLHNTSLQDHSELSTSSSELTEEATTYLSDLVKNMNEEVQRNIEDSIIEFRIDIIELTKKEASKESIADWYLNMNNLNRLAFDRIQKMDFLNDSKAKRLGVALVNDIVSVWISRSIAITGHERAHAEAPEKLGAETFYGHTSNPCEKMSLGSIFLLLLSSPLKGTAYTSWRFSDKTLSPKEEASIEAAGLNYHKTLASNLTAQNIRNGQTHMIGLIHLLYNKAAIGFYHYLNKPPLFNDLKHYVDSLEEQGYIEAGSQERVIRKLAQLNLLTVLMSGSIINSFRAHIEYIKSGDINIELITFDTGIGKITWPEFDVFLNTENISIRGAGAFLIMENGMIYQIEYEKNLNGTEISLSAYKLIKDKLHIEAKTRYNTGNSAYGGHLELGYELGYGWQLVGVLDYENGKNGGTWAGQRKYYTLDGEEFSGHLYIQKRF